MQVDNYTANEASKVYALTLSAVFERQLRIWARHYADEAEPPKVRDRKFVELLTHMAEISDIDLKDQALQSDLTENFFVANVVRHGDGPSCEILRTRASQLWDQSRGDYADLLVGPSPQSELLLILPADLLRYARATVRFWGLADRQPMAVIEAPF